MITELDISVLKFPQGEGMGADISLSFELQEQYNPYANGIDNAAQARLSAAYIDLFSLFVRYHENIDRVTLWGVSDANTWRNNWPINGRTDYPLPFDRDYQAKPFVQDIIALAEQHNTNTRLNSDKGSLLAKESK
jgi:endo-1,4-beta-xylanase